MGGYDVVHGTYSCPVQWVDTTGSGSPFTALIAVQEAERNLACRHRAQSVHPQMCYRLQLDLAG